MSKGTVPIPYIVALIFAVIVIALVAYLFFTGVIQFPGQTKEQWCNAEKLKYCYDWQKAGDDNYPSGGWDNYANGCTDVGVGDPKQDGCQKLGFTIT